MEGLKRRPPDSYGAHNHRLYPDGLLLIQIKMVGFNRQRRLRGKDRHARLMEPGNFFAELKRRNVYKVAAGYAVIAWLLIQAASILFPIFEVPAVAMKAFVVIVALGFVGALIIAWAFEMTPQGLKRTENVSPDEKIPHWSARKFTALILGVALGATGLLLFQLLRPKFSVNSPDVAPPQKSIAVLPFENLSRDPDNAFFADGMQDQILSNLAQIADLKVISRTSMVQYKAGGPRDLRQIGQQLGVTYLLEGSVQRAGPKMRLIAQLIDA